MILIQLCTAVPTCQEEMNNRFGQLLSLGKRKLGTWKDVQMRKGGFGVKKERGCGEHHGRKQTKAKIVLTESQATK